LKISASGSSSITKSRTCCRNRRQAASDAVFIAIGRASAKHVEIPARDAVKVLGAVSLLSDVASGAAPVLGRRVVVYGGGNTAVDAAEP